MKGLTDYKQRTLSPTSEEEREMMTQRILSKEERTWENDVIWAIVINTWPKRSEKNVDLFE